MKCELVWMKYKEHLNIRVMKGHSRQGYGEQAPLFCHYSIWFATKCEVPKAVSSYPPEMFDCLTDAC